MSMIFMSSGSPRTIRSGPGRGRGREAHQSRVAPITGRGKTPVCASLALAAAGCPRPPPRQAPASLADDANVSALEAPPGQRDKKRGRHPQASEPPTVQALDGIAALVVEDRRESGDGLHAFVEPRQ